MKTDVKEIGLEVCNCHYPLRVAFCNKDGCPLLTLPTDTMSDGSS